MGLDPIVFSKKPRTVSTTLTTSSKHRLEPEYISPTNLMSKHSVFHKSEHEKQSDEKRGKSKIKIDIIDTKEVSRKRKKGV